MHSSTDNVKSVVLRYVHEVQNAHDLDAIDDIFSADYKHQGGTAGESVAGREAIRPFYEEFLHAFPDLESSVLHQVAEGDMVASIKILEATHRGDYHGISATGNRVEFHIFDLFRVAEGKLVESWALLDEAAVLRQLGVDVPGWT